MIELSCLFRAKIIYTMTSRAVLFILIWWCHWKFKTVHRKIFALKESISVDIDKEDELWCEEKVGGNKAQKSHNNKIRLNALLSISPPQFRLFLIATLDSTEEKGRKLKENSIFYTFSWCGRRIRERMKNLMVVCVSAYSRDTWEWIYGENREDSKTRRLKMCEVEEEIQLKMPEFSH